MYPIFRRTLTETSLSATLIVDQPLKGCAARLVNADALMQYCIHTKKEVKRDGSQDFPREALTACRDFDDDPGDVMENMIVNVEVIARRGDRYLTIVRSDDEDFGGGWLCFPGGKLDPGIAEMHAIELTGQRELMEEVGLHVTVEDLTYVESHTFLIERDTCLDIVLFTDAASGTAIAIDPAEVAGLHWLTAEEIMSDPRVQEFTRTSLRLAIEKQPSNI